MKKITLITGGDRRNRYFTSILLPCLRGARKKAKIAVELNNRKQLLTVTLIYAKENNGKMPDRGDSYFLHALKYLSKANLNTTLIEKYLGTGPEIREKMMFCDSTLLDIRSPDNHPEYTNNHTANTANYSILDYYLIPKVGTFLQTNFDNTSIITAEEKKLSGVA
jgi:hypothetical protein